MGGPAFQIGEKYLTGRLNRQEYLETALIWVSGDNIEKYMTTHHKDEDAEEIWMHFRKVIDWVERIFPTYRATMKGRDWGRLYAAHKDDDVNPKKMESRIVELIDDEVEVLVLGFGHVLHEERPRHLAAFDEGLVHAEDVGTPLRLVGAEGSGRVKHAGRDEPAGAGLQAIGAREVEDAVVALVPVLEALPDLRLRRAGLEDRKSVV